METLTTIQEAALDYLNSRSRPNDRRCHRLAFRMVKEWCAARGWNDQDALQAARDMWDVWQLQRAAE